MIFEGKVDEAEVGKLEIGQDLKISLAAIPDKEFDAKLKFVAPKGTEEGGAVQFKIEADVTLDDDSFVRAGYSANGSLVVDNRQDIMVIAEAFEFGLPCVGWDIPGTNEAFCDGVSGRSVRFGDRLAVADLIEELLENQGELDRLVQGANERFNLFSIEGYADRILNAYSKRKKAICDA